MVQPMNGYEAIYSRTFLCRRFRNELIDGTVDFNRCGL